MVQYHDEDHRDLSCHGDLHVKPISQNTQTTQSVPSAYLHRLHRMEEGLAVAHTASTETVGTEHLLAVLVVAADKKGPRSPDAL